jgi:hypothetical protein
VAAVVVEVVRAVDAAVVADAIAVQGVNSVANASGTTAP